jgi:hypothetical protein
LERASTSYSQSLTGQTRLVLVDFVNNLLINFTMFSPLDSEAKQENGQYEADKVFSSFHLIGEHPMAVAPSER